MRTIAVVTVARSDYGIYLPILRRIKSDSGLELRLMASGAHLSQKFGSTVNEIERDGFHISDRIEMPDSSDDPQDIAKAMGVGTIGFSQAFARSRPDILLALGDRFEMHAAVIAALPFKIPVAHIHGGESTQGAIDESLRHSITKLSHLHFASTEGHAKRILQMGEEPWRVFVSGAPALDHLKDMALIHRQDLERQFSIDLSPPVLLVTFHPETLRHELTESLATELFSALEEQDAQIVFTYPNADTGSDVIIRMLQDFVSRHKRSRLLVNAGSRAYFSLMACVSAMVGNSSSGIVEAASFKLPVVDIGERQRGRTRPRNVVHSDCDRRAISAAIGAVLKPEFRAGLADLTNPYGTGNASEIIVSTLKSMELGYKLVAKKFAESVS